MPLSSIRRKDVQPGTWFYNGRTECFAIKDGTHADRKGKPSSLPAEQLVQQHDGIGIFDVVEITARVNINKLIEALHLAAGKQAENGHDNKYVFLGLAKQDELLTLEGDEHQTYYRAAVEIVQI